MTALSETDIDSSILDVIPGNKPDEYFVLGNWSDRAGDDETICCIVAVTSRPEGLAWQVLYSIETWGMQMSRLSPESYLIASVDGEVIRVTGSTRDAMDAGVGSIHCIDGVSDTDCWLTYDGGVSHWDGRNISRTFSSGWLHTLHGPRADFGVAVGAKGIVLLFDGAEWAEVESVPVNTELTQVFCMSDREIYIGGWRGVLYRWDGRDTWERIELLADNGERADCCIGNVVCYNGVLYVCASQLGLFRIEGSTAFKVQDFSSSRAAVIGDKLVITSWSTLWECDGHAWRSTQIPLP